MVIIYLLLLLLSSSLTFSLQLYISILATLGTIVYILIYKLCILHNSALVGCDVKLLINYLSFLCPVCNIWSLWLIFCVA